MAAHQSVTQGLAALPATGNFNSAALASGRRFDAAEFVSTAPVLGLQREAGYLWGTLRDDDGTLYSIILPDPQGRMVDFMPMPNPQAEGRWRRVGDTREPTTTPTRSTTSSPAPPSDSCDAWSCPSGSSQFAADTRRRVAPRPVPRSLGGPRAWKSCSGLRPTDLRSVDIGRPTTKPSIDLVSRRGS